MELGGVATVPTEHPTGATIESGGQPQLTEQRGRGPGRGPAALVGFGLGRDTGRLERHVDLPVERLALTGFRCRWVVRIRRPFLQVAIG